MSRICPLYSSSRGNSTYLAGGGTSLLVDAGVTFKRLREGFAARDFQLEQLAGVLITHEHIDHIRGLAVMLRRHNIPVYASGGTMEWLAQQGHLPAGTTTVVVDGPFAVGDVEVVPFETPHDAVHSMGYRFHMPDGRKVAVATDLGHISPVVAEHLEGCDLVLLESNYDRGMLDCGPYPYAVKRRIKGEHGHLSNEACAAEIVRLVRTGTTHLLLGHLSLNNNLPQIAYHTAKLELDQLGVRENRDYILQVARGEAPSDLLVF